MVAPLPDIADDPRLGVRVDGVDVAGRIGNVMARDLELAVGASDVQHDRVGAIEA